MKSHYKNIIHCGNASCQGIFLWGGATLPQKIEKAIVGTNIYNIMKHIPVGIMFLECPKGKVTYANDRAIELYGVNPLGLEIKNHSTKLMTILRTNGEPYPPEMLPMSRAIKGELVTNEELIIQRHNDGSRITVSASAVPLRDEKGEIVGSVGVFEDTTERKTLQEQLRNSERLAAIGETAGMVGHDIRNPLQSIMSELYIAKTEINDVTDSRMRETLKESIGNVEEQIAYINKIVSDLQDFARPVRPCIEEVNLEKLVKNVLSTIQIPKNVQIVYSLEKDASKLKTDSACLKRILINLTTNAVQAMPNGGRLTISTNRKDDKTYISVEDSGEGLSDEVKSKIFKPLVTTKSKGQGFGLAVVKRLTDALNGKISFESEKGKGTKFILEFP